jgi:hypothetical protein
MSEISDSDIGTVGDMVDDLVIQTTYRLWVSYCPVLNDRRNASKPVLFERVTS